MVKMKASVKGIESSVTVKCIRLVVKRMFIDWDCNGAITTYLLLESPFFVCSSLFIGILKFI